MVDPILSCFEQQLNNLLNSKRLNSSKALQRLTYLQAFASRQLLTCSVWWYCIYTHHNELTKPVGSHGSKSLLLTRMGDGLKLGDCQKDLFSFCLNWHNSSWCSQWYYEVFLSTSYIKLSPLIGFLKDLVGSSERLLGGDLCISTQVVTVFPWIECVQILRLKQESNPIVLLLQFGVSLYAPQHRPVSLELSNHSAF
jgi:hypothetical protein